MAPAKAELGNRIVSGFLALVGLAVLIMAASITPNPAGHGSHTQLGMPACGFAVALGKPCPTCGMTTAFAHIAHGQLWSALKVQPFAAALALVTAAWFWVGMYIAVTGSRVGSHAAKLLRPKVIWVVLALGFASWGYTYATWDSRNAAASGQPPLKMRPAAQEPSSP